MYSGHNGNLEVIKSDLFSLGPLLGGLENYSELKHWRVRVSRAGVRGDKTRKRQRNKVDPSQKSQGITELLNNKA